MATAPPPLPKKAVGHAFKALLGRVKDALDAPRLILVFEGALDRVVLEGLLAKVGVRGRSGSIAREELVGRSVGLFLQKKDFALAVMRQLDKSANKERNIVAEWADVDVLEHIKTYQAKDFRRERARMIWALVRDEREESLDAALALLDEAFAAHKKAKIERELLQDVSAEGAALPPLATSVERFPDAPSDDLKRQAVVQLRDRVSAYETALHENENRLRKAQSEHADSESERSRLIARMGQRQRALKHEEEERAKLQNEVAALQNDAGELRARLRLVDEERVAALEDERDAFRDRIRKLERVIEHQAQASEVLDENDRLHAENEALRHQLEREETQRESLLFELEGKEQAANARIEKMRSELKQARRAAACVDDTVSATDQKATRVGVYVDAANISASARRDHGGKMDFVSMLPALVGGRVAARAVAFIVEGREDGGKFDAFVTALREGGYAVRQKKPRVRSDGSQKADWDMGMAMEILDARASLDVVVLCTGDGDFVPLARKLRAWGLRVEAASFMASTDRALIAAVDSHTDLSGDHFRVQ